MKLVPGPKNLITDVDGILVGHAQDEDVCSGASVVLPENRATAAVDVRGGGPGTRETDALSPSCMVEEVDAIVLSGGSAFGLDAASGVQSWLREQGRGFKVADAVVPIVPSAILFDLINGGNKNWGDVPPYRDLGIDAAISASKDFELGNIGAGMGAKAGKLKGGLGSCSLLCGDLQVGAMVAANPFGSVVMPGGKCFWAWPFERSGEFGGFGCKGQKDPVALEYDFDLGNLASNTTIAVVATNVRLTKAQAQRIAIMAHDGFARSIRPVHTPFDGDTIFVMATDFIDTEITAASIALIGMMAADCVARAVARGVYHAHSMGPFKSYCDTFEI